MSDGDDEPSANDEPAPDEPDDGEHDASAADASEPAADDADDETKAHESAAEEDDGDDTTEADEAAGDATADEAAEESAEDDGTDEPADDADDGDTDEEGETDEDLPAVAESFDDRLDDIEADVESAETEADLDAVEERLDEVEADLEDTDLSTDETAEEDDGDDGGEDEEGDEDAVDPREELETRISELRDAIEAKRGPYAEDVVTEVESAKTTVAETRWTDQGKRDVVVAVETFLDDAGEHLDESFSARSDDDDALAAALGHVADAVEERTLNPDEDTDTIAGLLEAAEELTADLDDAQEWDDLTVREKLTAEGFYDVLTPETKKDFPPEWNAIKIYEKENDPEPILLGLDMFGSAFMEEHCIESLKRMGSPEAFDVMHQRAQKRNKPPIEVLGKIGDDRALETLHEYIEGESDPALQKVTLKAIGEIGSTDSTQAVADRLVAENETVRSNAARALGLIGDTRAISPLSDVLSEDDSNSVRASAAWALNQIGTESALDAAREYAEDRSFLVQSEAEKAEQAMNDGATERAA